MMSNHCPPQGAKLFYLSGIIHGQYQKTEIHNLGRFISVMKFRPLEWQSAHPYVLADRMEDLTNPEAVRENSRCDRTVSLYGYVRGTHLKTRTTVHIPGGLVDPLECNYSYQGSPKTIQNVRCARPSAPMEEVGL